MYSESDEPVILERDCQATLVPFGNKVTLKKGEEGHITQSLGGSYTIMIRGNLVRIESKILFFGLVIFLELLDY